MAGMADKHDEKAPAVSEGDAPTDIGALVAWLTAPRTLVVVSTLRKLRAIETAAREYRDAVVAKRAIEAQAGVDRSIDAQENYRKTYRAVLDDKRSKGEALFALLDGVSPEFAAATEAQRRVNLLDFDFRIMAEDMHPTTCAYRKATGSPHITECDCGVYAAEAARAR